MVRRSGRKAAALASPFKALASAAALRPERRTIVTNDKDFPTDVYIAEGLCRLLGNGYGLRRTTSPDRLADVLGDDVAAVAFSHVDYKSARIERMSEIAAQIHAAGALRDLGPEPQRRRAAGRLERRQCRLRGGVRLQVSGRRVPVRRHFCLPRDAITIRWPIHCPAARSRGPVRFGSRYRPAPGIARMITGTPPVVSMALLEAAVGIIADAGMERLRAKSMDMTSLLIDLIAQECCRHGSRVRVAD